MNSWIYNTGLAIHDLTRLWSTTQHHVIIVTGICLPILLLMGLKRGHVEDLRHELLSSPTGRQVVFWSAQGGAFLDETKVDSLEQDLPGVDLIIPEVQRVVELSAAVGETETERSDGTEAMRERRREMITLYSTRPRDPLLAQTQGDVLTKREKALVLSTMVAEAIGVQAGATVSLTVERERGGVRESASVDVVVKSVVDFGTGGSNIGYADIAFLALIEQYVRGYKVDEFNWPAFKAPVRDKYASYLVICERGNDLTQDDRNHIAERGLILETIDDGVERNLCGLIPDDVVDKLRIYLVHSTRSLADPKRRLAFAPSEIGEALEADCVVLPWNSPVRLNGENQKFLVVGMSMPKRIWLRNYLVDPAAPFNYDADALAGRPFGSVVDLSGDTLPIFLTAGDRIELVLGYGEGSEDREVPGAMDSEGAANGNDGGVEGPRVIGVEAVPDGAPQPATEESSKAPSEDPQADTSEGSEDELGSPQAEAASDEVIGVEAVPDGAPQPATEESSKAPSEDPQADTSEGSEDELGSPQAEAASDEVIGVEAVPDGAPQPATEESSKAPSEDPQADTSEGSEDELGSPQAEAASDEVIGVEAVPDGAPQPATEESSKAPSEDPPADTSEGSEDELASPQAEAASDEVITLIVPADLLAYIDAYENGLATFDKQTDLFVAVPTPAVYDKARLYAHTIDEVPAVVDALADRGFALMSEDSRIKEIHQQNNSLQMLVYFVGVGVFMFGVVTVFSVLVDSTDRKRNAIGILRVMGMSRGGIFYLVVFRAMVIGVMAALACVALGYGLAALLNWTAPQGTWISIWKPNIKVILSLLDISVVAAGALVCSAVGALLPAWRASRLDPFDAVVEGRFH